MVSEGMVSITRSFRRLKLFLIQQAPKDGTAERRRFLDADSGVRKAIQRSTNGRSFRAAAILFRQKTAQLAVLQAFSV
jgi:hypothetical protein